MTNHCRRAAGKVVAAPPRPTTARRFKGGIPCLFAAFLLALAGCAREAPPSAAEPAKPALAEALDWFTPVPIGVPFVGSPWIAHVDIVDLDRDGLLDVLACDVKAQAVVWLRQTEPGKFEEAALATELRGPVQVGAVDFDHDSDLDLLVACMGQVFPNNDKIGSVVILDNDGHQRFTSRVIIDNVARVTDVRAGDFNGDGRLDLAVAQFGYDQGEIRWMENLGDWKFQSYNPEPFRHDQRVRGGHERRRHARHRRARVATMGRGAFVRKQRARAFHEQDSACLEAGIAWPPLWAKSA